MNLDLTLKAFERPDERREFEMGCFEIVHVGGMTIGRAAGQPTSRGGNGPITWGLDSVRSSVRSNT
jgi:hypothetical protein